MWNPDSKLCIWQLIFCQSNTYYKVNGVNADNIEYLHNWACPTTTNFKSLSIYYQIFTLEFSKEPLFVMTLNIITLKILEE